MLRASLEFTAADLIGGTVRALKQYDGRTIIEYRIGQRRWTLATVQALTTAAAVCHHLRRLFLARPVTVHYRLPAVAALRSAPTNVPPIARMTPADRGDVKITATTARPIISAAIEVIFSGIGTTPFVGRSGTDVFTSECSEQHGYE
jgi:hypothetical protein